MVAAGASRRSVTPIFIGAVGGALLGGVSAGIARQIEPLGVALLAAVVVGVAAGVIATVAFKRPAATTSNDHAVVSFEVTPNVPPHRVHALAVEVASEILEIRSNPAPACRTVKLGTSAVSYEIEFAISSGTAAAVCCALLTRLWYRLGRSVSSGTSETLRAEAATTLQATPLFDFLPEDIRREIAKHAEVELWAAGECVVMQDEPGDSCFIVRSGRLGVHVADGGAETRFATLGAGDLFGEMSLLTGQPRWATVRAEEDSQLLRVGANAMKVALTRSPELVARMAETVALRREELLEAKALLARREAHGRLTGTHLPNTIREYMDIPDGNTIS